VPDPPGGCSWAKYAAVGPPRLLSKVRRAQQLTLGSDNGPGPAAVSRDRLNSLPPPGWRLKGIREILCFVDDLAVAELHNAHRVCRAPLVRDCVLRDPEISVSKNPFDLKAGRLPWMMTPQRLQIASLEDSLPRLGIITNGIVRIIIVFRVYITRSRRLPVRIQGRPDLFLLNGLL